MYINVAANSPAWLTRNALVKNLRCSSESGLVFRGGSSDDDVALLDMVCVERYRAVRNCGLAVLRNFPLCLGETVVNRLLVHRRAAMGLFMLLVCYILRTQVLNLLHLRLYKTRQSSHVLTTLRVYMCQVTIKDP